MTVEKITHCSGERCPHIYIYIYVFWLFLFRFLWSVVKTVFQASSWAERPSDPTCQRAPWRVADGANRCAKHAGNTSGLCGATLIWLPGPAARCPFYYELQDLKECLTRDLRSHNAAPSFTSLRHLTMRAHAFLWSSRIKSPCMWPGTGWTDQKCSMQSMH